MFRALLVLGITAFAAGRPEGSDATITIGGCLLKRQKAPSNLPLLTNILGKRLYPKNKDYGDIFIPVGTFFNVSCATPTNRLRNSDANEVQVLCDPLGDLRIASDLSLTSFDQLGCSNLVKEDIRTVGTCYNGYSNISIGFTSANKYYPLITICHDNVTDNSFYSEHTVEGPSITTGAELSNNRPSFKKAQYYGKVSPDDLYSQKNQAAMFESLLGSGPLANKYVNPCYLARGHLSPDGDFVFISEQNATYYFPNVVPQWQCINNGNWKALEMAVRKLAADRDLSLKVYTGGFNVLKLSDVNNNRVEMYLGRDPITGKLVIPVPRLSWKIIHDPIKQLAVAIVMVNNPHDAVIADEDKICKSQCDDLPWVTWDTENIPKGYTMCCSLESFSKMVPYAPKLGTTKLFV